MCQAAQPESILHTVTASMREMRIEQNGGKRRAIARLNDTSSSNMAQIATSAITKDPHSRANISDTIKEFLG